MLHAAAPRPERVTPAPAPRPRGEHAYPILLAAGVAVISLLPYLLAYLVTPKGQHFMGFFFLADDATSYLTKMRAGLEGGWLWDNRYVSVAPHPVLVYPFYMALGHLARLLHLPLIATYHLARLTGGAALALLTYRLAGELGLNRTGRRVATLLAFFGSGFGFVAQLFGNPPIGPLRLEAVDLHLPEITGFYSTLAIPHFVWAAALLVAGMLLVLRSVDGTDPRTPLAAALVWNALALIHPQMLPVAILWVAAWLALRFTTPTGLSRRALARVGLGFAATLPLLAYDAWLLRSDPMVRRWSAQWTHAAPDPLSMALALGLPLLLAVLALPAAWRRRGQAEGLLACWLVVVAFALYLPNPASIQRRLLDGIYIPIALLAAQRLLAPGPIRQNLLLPAAARRAARRRASLALAVSSVSSLLVLAIGFRFAVGTFPEIYQSDDTMAAFQWLRAAPRGAVLSSPGTGLYVPAWSGQRVYVGHYSETVDYLARGRTAGAILSADTPDAVVRSLFEREALRYLFWGPAERAGRSFDPAGKAYLEPVFARGTVEIYRFRSSSEIGRLDGG